MEKLGYHGIKIGIAAKTGGLVELSKGGTCFNGSSSNQVNEKLSDGDRVRVEVDLKSHSPQISWSISGKVLYKCEMKIRWEIGNWVPYISLGESDSISILN